ncbi:MAG: hypothetical protein KIH62_001475 [Candidatus Kerfeldbacteria bacterium]|nr:hypothetical protein [Candidatus Kerfeldbacteria bacterium]
MATRRRTGESAAPANAGAQPQKSTLGGQPVDTITVGTRTAARGPEKARIPELKEGTVLRGVTASYVGARKPGEYSAECVVGGKRLDLRVFTDNAHYVLISSPQKVDVRLLETPQQQGGKLSARAVVDGASVDLSTIEHIARSAPARQPGELVELGRRTLTQLEPGVFAVSGQEADNRAVRVRSLLGWKPEMVKDRGVEMVAADNVRVAMLRGGVDAYMYEALPEREAILLSQHIRFVNILNRYAPVITALSQPDGFRDHMGKVLPWEPEGAWAPRVRTEIATRMIEVLGAYFSYIAANAPSEQFVDTDYLEAAMNKLEEFLYGAAFFAKEESVPSVTILPTAQLKLPQAQHLEELHTFFAAAMPDASKVWTPETLRTVGTVMDAATEELPDDFIERAPRGGDLFATLNVILEDAGLPRLQRGQEYVVKGRIDTSTGTPRFFDLSDALRIGTVLDDPAVVFSTEGNLSVLFDSVQARARRAVSIQTARSSALTVDIAPDMLPRTTALREGEFIDALKAGHIEMRTVQVNDLDSTVHALEHASTLQIIGYINGRSEKSVFPRSFIDARSRGEGAAITRAIVDRLSANLRVFLSPLVIDRVEIARQDLDVTTIELTVVVHGVVCAVSLNGKVEHDRKAFEPFRKAIAEAKAARDAQEADGGRSRLYAWLQAAPLVNIIGYVQGELLEESTVPQQYRSYRTALRGPADFAAGIRERVLARVRADARLPDNAVFVPVSNDPFVVKVTCAGVPPQHMTVTGDPRTDEPVFRGVRDFFHEQLAAPKLLERFNADNNIFPPLVFGETARHTSGIYPSDEFRISGISYLNTTQIFNLTPVAGGSPWAMSLSEFAAELERGFIYRDVLKEEDAYINDASPWNFPSREIHTNPERALAFNGMPATEMGGRFVRRFRLAVQYNSGKEKGKTYRVIRVDGSTHEMICAQETSEGILVEPTVELVMDTDDVIRNPHWFEIPDNSVYIRVAQAFDLRSPELARQLFEPGRLELVNPQDGSTLPFSTLRITPGGIACRYVGGGSTITMTVDNFIEKVRKNEILITGAQSERITQANEDVPLDPHVSFGQNARYRFERALRRLQSVEFVEDFENGKFECVEVVDGTQHTAVVTVLERDEVGCLLKFEPEIVSSPARFTYEAIIAAKVAGIFRADIMRSRWRPARSSPPRAFAAPQPREAPSIQETLSFSRRPSDEDPTKPYSTEVSPEFDDAGDDKDEDLISPPGTPDASLRGRPLIGISPEPLVPIAPVGGQPEDPTSTGRYAAPVLRTPAPELPPQPLGAVRTWVPDVGEPSRTTPPPAVEIMPAPALVEVAAPPNPELQRMEALQRVLTTQLANERTLLNVIQQLSANASRFDRLFSFRKYAELDRVAEQRSGFTDARDFANYQQLKNAAILLDGFNQAKLQAIRAIDPGIDIRLVDLSQL